MIITILLFGIIFKTDVDIHKGKASCIPTTLLSHVKESSV